MKRCVFALGFFDGAHLGHQALLEACVAMAERLDAAAGAITFDAHPKALFSDRAPKCDQKLPAARSPVLSEGNGLRKEICGCCMGEGFAFAI